MYSVLLVEDNEMNRNMLSRRLERRGYTVEVACDGEEAVRLATRLRPAIILMDIGLPKLDGHDATRILKGQPETKSIPVIALTAHAMADDRRKALESGCDEYETKPVDLVRLLGKMEALLAQSIPRAAGVAPAVQENP